MQYKEKYFYKNSNIINIILNDYNYIVRILL